MRVEEEREWVGDLIEGRKKRVKEGVYVGKVEWGEREYYEWVRGRFGGAEEEEEVAEVCEEEEKEVEVVEEVLSGKEDEVEEGKAMEVVVQGETSTVEKEVVEVEATTDERMEEK